MLYLTAYCHVAFQALFIIQDYNVQSSIAEQMLESFLREDSLQASNDNYGVIF
jgi:hypothetical protein